MGLSLQRESGLKLFPHKRKTYVLHCLSLQRESGLKCATQWPCLAIMERSLPAEGEWIEIYRGDRY